MPRGEWALIYFYMSSSNSPQSSPLSPRLRLSHSSPIYPLRWVGSTFLRARSAWQPRGSCQENEVRSGRLLGDDGWCFDWAPRLRAASIHQENKGTGCIRWMQKPWLTIFWVAVIADLAARRQIPAP
jgi:hypothetical protein